ncbi:YdeI/OmpD-associated family protein [Marinifilum caeruleilacunae]|jgi:uncharacterized protein YdeI (YjbR/CyaY-like superfamily)|uniref:YdhG-like domain-containing protein n=1 Tax=Marinifilum caeruleilacunae TaxID=2499076 RepID=A0ABX1WZS4_9BACT|nr:DUF1801 domain-containing protein [Marinifilum caeruleilacunae]NOU61517.1 hypothetical protein [Marinifilum caeruleilacunae]
MKKATTVDEYIDSKTEWIKELVLLRSILQKTELVECIKWGAPTYTIANKNVVGIGAFKSYVGIWFFNGALLSDPVKKLHNAQEGKTQAMRQLRFASINEIDEKMLLTYLNEAIENQKAGKQVKVNKRNDLEIPELLTEKLKGDLALNDSFKSLSPYKQKEYILHIAEAKREATKIKRLEKIVPMIKSGIGLHDKYRNC